MNRQNWSDDYWNSLTEELDKLLDEEQVEVIKVICERIKAVGEMNVTSAKQITNLVVYANSDLPKIKKLIRKYTKLTNAEIDKLFRKVAQDSTEFSQLLAKDAGTTYNKNFDALVQASAKRYKDNVLNLADTYAFRTDGVVKTIREQYIHSVNKAIAEVTTGTTDYHSAMRQTIKEMADSGLRITPQGESKVDWYNDNGEVYYSRRLDSSVRMNVLEGVRQVNQEILSDAAEEFATGYEWSAHARPAPDHAPYQGKQFTKIEFEDLNKRLKRPVGTLNCYHIAFPIIYGVTPPTYSDKELAQMREDAAKTITWNGKEFNGYEATQQQRRMETSIRKQKDKIKALKAFGDVQGVTQEKKKLKYLTNQYKDFSNVAGLSVKNDRLDTVKIKSETIRNRNADPIKEIYGPIYKSHPEEMDRIIKKAQELGVEILPSDGSISYQPANHKGKPGQLRLSEEDSIGAWIHEESHMLDDYNAGWPGPEKLFSIAFRRRSEYTAYNKEMDIAIEAGRQDIAKRLQMYLNLEYKKIGPKRNGN